MDSNEKHVEGFENKAHLNKKTAEELAEKGGLFNLSDDQRYILDLIRASAERTVKMLWVIIILLIVALCSSNACWIYYESDVKPMLIEKAIEGRFDINPDTVEIRCK